MKLAFSVLFVFLSATALAQTPTPKPTATPAPVSTAAPEPTPAPSKPVAAKRQTLEVRSSGGLSMGRGAYETKRLDCKEVRLSWLAGDPLARGPELLTVVKNEGGASGIQFFMDKSGVVTGVKTWSNHGGTTNATSIPGMPKIDWVDCHDSDPIGGIWVEYVDASKFGP